MGIPLLILALAAAARGMKGSANANEQARNELAKRKAELDTEYKYDYNMDYLNTPQAKSALSLLSKEYIERSKQVAQGNVISAKSDEFASAVAGEMQKPFVGTLSNLAGYGEQARQATRRNYLYSKEHLNDLTYQNTQQKGQNWANFGTNAVNAALGFAEADAYGESDKKDQGYLKNIFKWGGKIGQ